eukprot:644005_1
MCSLDPIQNKDNPLLGELKKRCRSGGTLMLNPDTLSEGADRIFSALGEAPSTPLLFNFAWQFFEQTSHVFDKPCFEKCRSALVRLYSVLDFLDTHSFSDNQIVKLNEWKDVFSETDFSAESPQISDD